MQRQMAAAGPPGAFRIEAASMLAIQRLDAVNHHAALFKLVQLLFPVDVLLVLRIVLFVGSIVADENLNQHSGDVEQSAHECFLTVFGWGMLPCRDIFGSFSLAGSNFGVAAAINLCPSSLSSV